MRRFAPIVLLGFHLLGGCSILMTRSVASHGPEKCTVSVGPPAADTAIVAAAIAGAVYTTIEKPDVDHITIPIAAGIGIIYGISAAVGYSRATTCKQARIKEGIAY
jgi:hypothetical protein